MAYGRYPRMGNLMRTPTTDDVAWGIVDPNDPRMGTPVEAGAAPTSRVPGAAPPPSDPRAYENSQRNRTYLNDGPPDAPSAPDAPSTAPSAPSAPAAPPQTAPPVAPNPNDPYQAALKRIQAAYTQYLGRPGTEAEWASHLGNGRNFDTRAIDYGITNIMRSGEAQEYAARRAAGGSTADPNTPPAPGGSHSYTGGPLDYYGTGDIEGAEGIKRGSVGKVSGFTEDGLNGNTAVRGSNSIKNVNGRIFSNYPAKPSSIPLVLADPAFKAKFPNAKQVGFDKIDYGDGKPVDVLRNADPNADTADAWDWMPESETVPETAGKGYTAWKASQQAGGGTTPPPSSVPNEFAYQNLASRRSYPTAGQWAEPGLSGSTDEWLI